MKEDLEEAQKLKNALETCKTYYRLLSKEKEDNRRLKENNKHLRKLIQIQETFVKICSEDMK